MDILEAFLNSRHLGGCKPQTLIVYKTFIAPFIEFLHAHEPQIDLLAYLERYPNSRTRYSALTQIRVFTTWAFGASLIDCNYALGVRVRKIPKAQEPTLSPSDLDRLLAVMPPTAKGRRDRVLFGVLFFTGARRDAVRKLRRADVMIQDRLIRITSKGDKESLKPLAPRAALALNEWMAWAARKWPASPWVFPSTRHPERAIHASAVTHALPRYARAAGFTGRVYVHLLRHSFATELHLHDVPLDTIQAALDHSSIQTTALYVRRLADTVKVKRAVDRTFGA